jgi:hypothetical protein
MTVRVLGAKFGRNLILTLSVLLIFLFQNCSGFQSSIGVSSDSGFGILGPCRRSSPRMANLFSLPPQQGFQSTWTIEDGAWCGNQTAGTAAHSVQVDSLGNAIVVGNTDDPLNGVEEYGYGDYFIAKYNPNGGLLWLVQDGSPYGYASASQGAVDAFGNIYVAGNTSIGLDGKTQIGATDLFVSKYDSNGHRIWTAEDGVANGISIASALGIDSSGNVYVTGFTSAGLDGQTQAGLRDIFYSKYDSSGNLLWTLQDGGPSGLVYGNAVAVDSKGFIYFGGTTNIALDGQALHGAQDFFVTKYDTGGNRIWTLQDGATNGLNWLYGIAADSSGNILMTGAGNVGLDGLPPPTGYAYFLTKYTSAGARIWTVQDGAKSVSATAVTTDAQNNAYVVGTTSQSIDGKIVLGTSDVFVTKYSQNGNRIWTAEDGSPVQSSNAWPSTYGSGVAVDTHGNVYITGDTHAPIDGQVQNGADDLYLSKYDLNGNRIWTVQNGAPPGDTEALAVAVDSGGDVIVAGVTSFPLEGQTQSGSFDLFIQKYAMNGALLWTVQDGAPYGDTEIYGVAVDAGGNIYVVGETDSPLDGQTQHAGSFDYFISKYDPHGNRIWTVQDGSPGVDADSFATGVAVDSTGNVYVVGATFGPIDEQPPIGSQDYFLTKYDSLGHRLWTAENGSTNGLAQADGVTVDTMSNIVITGNTDGSINGQTQHGTLDLFVIKYNSSGKTLWTVQDGATGGSTFASSIASDSSGNVYLTGSVNKPFDGHQQFGNYDLFISKYSSAGQLSWSLQDGASQGSVQGSSVTMSPDGFIYVTGFTNVGMDGEALVGDQDVLITKYDGNGNRVATALDGANPSSIAQGSGVVVDSRGNVYAVGSTDTPLDGLNVQAADSLFIKSFTNSLR